MPNWERTPPVSGLSIDEMRQRVADGIKRRRDVGELRPLTKAIKTVTRGPAFTKVQRAEVIKAANLCIYALANAGSPGSEQDYCDAANTIDLLRLAAGYPSTLMQSLLTGVAHEAAELAGEPVQVLNQLARRWLCDRYAPRTTVFSQPTKDPSDG